MNTTIIKTPPEGIEPIGIIHFLHGMAEHKERYEQTLSFFSARGYICSIRDMRGHGDNLVEGNGPGYLGKERLNGLLKEVHHTVLSLKHHYPHLPFYLAGHSMGSLLARAYCKKYEHELNGLIVIGSPSYNPAAPFGIALIKLMSVFRGSTHVSPMVADMVTGSFQKTMPTGSKPNSWICSDESVVDRYNADSLCGFAFTLNGYQTLLELMRFVYQKKGWHIKKPNLPVLFLSGKEDPCMISEQDFRKAVRRMKEVGYQNVSSKLYRGMRHEILNEKEKDLVLDDMLNFLGRLPVIWR